MIQGMHLTAIGACNTLLEPGAGLDPSDPDTYLEPLLDYLQQHNARRLLYDLGDVHIIDEVYYDWLLRLYAICHISGIELVTVNIRPPAAFALSLVLDTTPPFTCALDVNQARHPAAILPTSQ
jgi:rsbT antagonist protein RsbS